MGSACLLSNAATSRVEHGVSAREVWKAVQARRRGSAAARLHIQVVSLFSIIAVLPAVLVAIVANVTIDRGLDRLFSGPTRAVIQNSLIVANAYLHEHAQLIRGDIIGMANDISQARPLFKLDPLSFRQMLTTSAASRNLPGAMLIDKDRNILESAQTGIQQEFTTPDAEFLKGVDENEPQIAVFIEANYVAAVIRLRGLTDTFLYVARVLDPRVVAQLRHVGGEGVGVRQTGGGGNVRVLRYRDGGPAHRALRPGPFGRVAIDGVRFRGDLVDDFGLDFEIRLDLRLDFGLHHDLHLGPAASRPAGIVLRFVVA